jgi:hypothetical protein
MGRRLEISLYWVKAHVGNSGNERADALVKQGAATSIVVPAPFILCSLFCQGFHAEGCCGRLELKMEKPPYLSSNQNLVPYSWPLSQPNF